jgi:endoglucanase
MRTISASVSASALALVVVVVGLWVVNPASSADGTHPTDGAQVVHVGAVAPDILAIEIQSGEYKPGAMVPYTAQPDDKLTGGSKEWVVRDGKLVQETVGQVVSRKDDKGKDARLGVLSFDGKWILQSDSVAGTALATTGIEAPAAYEIQSTDDPALAKAVAPAAVYRKSKPNCPLNGNGAIAVLHEVYLKLPSPLKEGVSYTVNLKGLNTRQETVTYKHDTRTARSGAVHVTQVGYRPDDPFKRGYLSMWMGTGGPCQYASPGDFDLVDAQSGKTVFTGKCELGRTNDVVGWQKANYAFTPVYWLDFSAFRTPGTYAVRVPGIGVSYPFAIAAAAWEVAFKIGMRGVLSQRTGIALGPPFLDFKRPRPCHPDDGAKFYQIDIGIAAGQEGARGDAIVRLWKANGKLDEVKGMWGGYQDAGDWDTYTTTLATSAELTEAFEITGAYGKAVKLSLPEEEAANKIPDLLDEALWGLAAYKRLQLPSGAVRDGFGDGWGCRACDVSWNDSNPVCVYTASPDTTWSYAATAARMARLLAPCDAAQAREYGQSAVSAWKWAESQGAAAATAPAAADRKNPGWLYKHAAEAAAAVALYQFTREPAYHERFKQICEIQQDIGTTYAGGAMEPMHQADATFAYALLGDDLADPVLKEHARNRHVLAGNVAVYFMQHNAFNLATSYPGMPMREFCAFFTNPGMGPHVVRAHAVTKDPRYLQAVVASTGFGLGANGENLSFTTGLGANPIRFPLKLDSMRTGQPAPVGITVYGPSDQSVKSQFSDWVHTWIMSPGRMVPGSRTWPPPECYADVFTWPGGNEYCVNSPLTSAVYVWAYLAARQ